MMRSNKPVDGFVPRRVGSATQPNYPSLERAHTHKESSIRPTHEAVADSTLKRPQSVSRAEIDDSLRQIDESHPELNAPKTAKPKRSRRKLLKRLILGLTALGVVVLIGFAIKFVMTSNSLFKGNLFGLVQSKPLKEDANGRSNILLLGTSEDDPGHQGAHLTDSLMILSVDQKNKQAQMFSIPRDMQVMYGRRCNTGDRGKINEFFNCVNEDWTSEKAEEERQTEARKFFGDIVGLDIQYSVHVNYTVMRDLVGALGGIRVTIESADPRGQMDSNFDWKCGYGDPKVSAAERKRRCPPNGHFIDFPNGPVDLDAEHALYLAQARGGDGSPFGAYGFARSNPDREQNQQKILVAIKEKAMSAGTLANPAAVFGIMEAMGKNLRTNFATEEVGTLITLAKDIPAANIKTSDLMKDGVMDGTGNPAAGAYNFTALRAYIKKQFTTDPIVREEPVVEVYNASGVAGAAQKEVDALAKLGIVATAGNAPSGNYAPKTLYVINDKKPAARAKLEQLYGVKAQTSSPSVTYADKTDFVLILGKVTTEN